MIQTISGGDLEVSLYLGDLASVDPSVPPICPECVSECVFVCVGSGRGVAPALVFINICRPRAPETPGPRRPGPALAHSHVRPQSPHTAADTSLSPVTTAIGYSPTEYCPICLFNSTLALQRSCVLWRLV